MVLNLQSAYTLFSLALPLIVAGVAGLIRQDRLPALVNEVISHALVFVLAAVSLALQGKLSLNYSGDLMLVVAYTATLLNSPLLKPLQGYIQSNLVSFGAKPSIQLPQNAPAVVVDAAKLAEQAAPLILKQLARDIASQLPQYERMQATTLRAAVNPQEVPVVKPNAPIGG